MPIMAPSEIAGLLTLGAMILAAVTALLLCLQRPDDRLQPAAMQGENGPRPDLNRKPAPRLPAR